MKCQDCIFFHEARDKFTLRYNQVAFLCVATGETMSAHSEASCDHFRLFQPDQGPGKKDARDTA